MPNSSMNPAPPHSRRKQKSSPTRWGIVGSILSIGLFAWYVYTNDARRQSADLDAANNLELIACPRCANNPALKTNCSLCNGAGRIWVNKDAHATPAASPAP